MRTYKQKWMRLFERSIIAKMPEQAGHIDWDIATYLYLQKHSIETAVKIYCANR